MPIERIICNFVMEVPLPPPGKVKVQYQIGDEELTFARPPRNNPISWTDINFNMIFLMVKSYFSSGGHMGPFTPTATQKR